MDIPYRYVFMELITLHEATRLLNVSPDTIHRWARRGLLANARPNQSNAVFSKDELLRVHKTHRTRRPEGRYRVLTTEPTPLSQIALLSCGSEPKAEEKAAATDPRTVTRETPLVDLALDWSEKQLPEHERTKHVHRLHPYLGKYIPQLVEVFLRKFFTAGDTVLDPFAGSGTTLVQAGELGIHSVGCDVSAFNVLLARVKTDQYDTTALRREAEQLIERLAARVRPAKYALFGEAVDPVDSTGASEYLKRWFAPRALEELIAFKELLEDSLHRGFFSVVLSRAARSSRLTTHFDLDFPKEPVTEPYKCYKHDNRMCKPTEIAFPFLMRYADNAVRRAAQYAEIRAFHRGVKTVCLHGDSRSTAFPPCEGLVTSPPYVGLIDYHEQHRYAYELLGLEDRSGEEIGAASGGKSRRAIDAYTGAMKEVFANAVSSIRPGGRVVVVANDAHGLYPGILTGAGLVHEATVERQVIRRTGRRAGEYHESVFVYMKV